MRVSITTVKDVPDDVEMVGGQALDDPGNLNDKVFGPAVFHQAGDNLVIVFLFVETVLILLQKLLHHIGEILGQGLAHLRTGVFGGSGPADLDQAINGELIPVVQVRAFLFLFNEVQLFAGVIDERSQLFQVFKADCAAQLVHDFAADGARGVLHHVVKGLVLAVDIGQEVLCALRQV